MTRGYSLTVAGATRIALTGVAGIALTGVAAGDGPLGRIELDQPLPNIVLPRLSDGKLISIADFRGKKVLLHVFASW